jgi:transposase
MLDSLYNIVYKLNMATIRKQKVGKYTYWQIVESRRVNGKPRPFLLAHLGTAEQLLYKLKEGPFKKKIRSASHGAVHLFYKTATELDLVNIFTNHFAQQKRDGLKTGQSLLLAALHRAIHPGSKRAFANWAKQTTLPQLAVFDPQKLDSQHFWDQMDTVTEQELATVEKEITLKLKDKGLLTPKLLFYDLTNFFTYIDSANEKSELAKRGRNKQKRNDLKQFGLAQIVTKDFLLPVCSSVYEGNKTDKELFIPQLTQLRTKLAELSISVEEITLVFDKGSNTKDNFAELDNKEIPYVASLSPAYHDDLINIPNSSYTETEKHFCYRTRKEIWGKERTVVLYISEKLRQGQLRGLEQALQKKYEQLTALKTVLTNPRARKKEQSTVENKVREILSGERGPELIKVTILEKEKGRFDLTWELDRDSYRWLTEIYYGKKILVTCRDEWSNEDIICAYNGQSNVERVFKHFKNPYHNAVQPQFHWTDQKIKVHTFICITGLLLSQVLWKKAKDLGYISSIETIIDELSRVRQAEIVTVTGLKGKAPREIQLEEMEPELEKMYNDMAEMVI